MQCTTNSAENQVHDLGSYAAGLRFTQSSSSSLSSLLCAAVNFDFILILINFDFILYYNLLLCFIQLEVHVRLICAIKFYLLTYLLIIIIIIITITITKTPSTSAVIGKYLRALADTITRGRQRKQQPNEFTTNSAWRRGVAVSGVR